MIREATSKDIEAWARLRNSLWPHCSIEQCENDAAEILKTDRETCFIHVDSESQTITGFLEVSTRDYSEGCDSSPVGYLEGIFVEESKRRKGIALELVESSYSWMLGKGCTEVGSDALLENVESIEFHKKIGFVEVERQVVFKNKIKANQAAHTTPVIAPR